MRSHYASQISDSLLHFEITEPRNCKIMGMVGEMSGLAIKVYRSFIFQILSSFRNHSASKATGVKNQGRIFHFLTHEKFMGEQAKCLSHFYDFNVEQTNDIF